MTPKIARRILRKHQWTIAGSRYGYRHIKPSLGRLIKEATRVVVKGV